MYEIIPGKRYLGEFEIKRSCEKRNIRVQFKALFSFEAEKEENDTVLIKNLNPYQINEILPFVKEMKIYLKKDGSIFVIKGYIKENSDGIYTVSLDRKSIYREKRRFHRFSFCCEDLGKYRIKKDENPITEDACIIEVSRSGLKILTKLHSNLEKNDRCIVESLEENVKFDINVVDIKEEYGYHIIRAKIIKTNINLINFVINGYVRTAEKIILKGK